MQRLGRVPHAFVDEIDPTIGFDRSQRLESLAGAEHAFGCTGDGVVDDAVHGAAQGFLLGLENPVVHAVQTPYHVYALIQIRIDLSAESQHDGALRCLLESDGDDAMLMLLQISAWAHQQFASLKC